MPQVIPLVLAAAAYLAAPAGGLILFGGALKIGYAAIIGTVVMMAATVAVGMLTKPRRPVAQGLAEDRKQLVRGSIEPGQVIYGAAKVSGAIVYAASSGANLRFLHLVVVLACHRVSSIGAIWINGTLIEPGDLDAGGNLTNASHPMRNRVRIKRYTGTQTTADADLVAESPDGWASDHVLTDQAYLYIRLEYDQERMPGLQEVQAYVEGRLVLDPRSSTTAFTNNWALCVLDYLRSDFGLACTDDEIDTASFIAAANLSDEAVPLNAGGTITQPRYRCDGAFKLERTAQDVMGVMLAAGAGTLVYVQGRYRIHGGAYSAPAVTITEDDFAGPMQVTRHPPRAELFNGVRGTFVDRARQYQAVEFGQVWDNNARTEDGGVEIWRDIELPMVNDRIAAERLAHIMLKRHRNGLRFRAPLKYTAVRFCVWQIVAVTHADFGWSAKPFRITGWDYDPTSGEITVEMQEEQASNYTWLWDQASATPDTPSTSLVNPLTIPTPAAPTLTASAALNSDGQSVPSIAVTVFPPAQPFITGMEVEWRPAGGTWQSIPVPPGTTRADIWPVIGGASYEVRTRARTQLLSSAVSASTSITAVSDTTAPAVPTGLAGTATPRGVQLAWTANTEADLDRYRVWERATLGDAFTAVASTYANQFLRADLTPGTSRRYSISAADRTGNESARSAEVVVAAGSLPTTDLSGQVTDAQIASGITGSKVSGLPTANLSGTISNAQVATGLDAAKLTTGILDQARITVLDAAKVSGALSSATLASANLTGQVTDAQIATGITGSKVSALPTSNLSGTISNAQVATGLDAAKLTTGILDQARITVLDAAKVSGALTGATLAAANLSTQITATNIATDAVTAPKILAGAIVSDKIGAGQVTAAKLGVVSDNVIWNSCCTVTTDGWSLYGDAGWNAGGATLYTEAPASIWTLRGVGQGAANIGGTPNGPRAVVEWSTWLPILGGQRVAAAVLIGNHRFGGGARVQLMFGDGNQSYVSEHNGNDISTAVVGGPNLENWGKSSLIMTAPSTARYVKLRVTATPNGQTNPILFFTQAQLSIAPANATEVGEWTPGGITSITGGVIVTDSILSRHIAANQVIADKINANAVTAPKIQAGAVTTTKLGVGFSGNLISNSCLGVSNWGWSPGGDTPPTAWGAVGVNGLDATWRLIGRGSGFATRGSIPAGNYMDVYFQRGDDAGAPAHVPGLPNTWYEAQVRLQAHRCTGFLNVAFYNDTGTYIGEASLGSVTNNSGGATGGRAIGDYSLVWGKFQTPTNTRRIMFFLRATNSIAAEPYLIWTQCYLGLSPGADQSEPAPWAPGGLTTVEGGMIATDAVLARHVSANAITADKIQANAVTTDKVQANAITGGKIASDTIATRSLLVAPGNICPDGFFYDWGSHAAGQFWEPDANGWYAEEPTSGAFWQAGMGVRRALIIGDWVAVVTARRHVWSRAGRFMPASAGQQYRLRAKARSSANQTIFVALVFYDWNNSFIGLDAVSWTSADSAVAGAYKEKTITAPANSAYMRVAIYNDGGTTFAGMVCLSDIQVEAAVTATMVVQGNAVITGSAQVQDLIIGTTKITDNAITTLTAGSFAGASATAGGLNYFADFFPALPAARDCAILVNWRYGLVGTGALPEMRLYANGSLVRTQIPVAKDDNGTMNHTMTLPGGTNTLRLASFGGSSSDTIFVTDITFTLLSRAK